MSGPFDAVTCIGASQIWGPDVAEAQPLDYAAALTALRALLPRGGRLVYGEGIWSAPPTPAAVAPLSGRDDEYVALDRLVALAEEHGFGVMAVHEASLDEWDAFESGFTAGWVRWLAEHEPDDPEAAEVRARAARQHAAYLGGLPRRPRARLPAPGGAVTVDVERIDVDDLDLTSAGELADDRQRCARPPYRCGATTRPRRSCSTCRDHGARGPVRRRSGWPGVDGRLVGYAAAARSTSSRTSTAPRSSAPSIPTTNGTGIGRALMEAAEAATDRPRLRAPAWAGTAGRAGACPRMGYTQQGSHEVRRLALRDPQPAALLATRRAAATGAATTTSSASSAPAPRQLLGEMQLLREAINDAPEDGDFEAYPPDRIRRYERVARRARHQTPYTDRGATPGHRAQAAGLTLVCVPELRPAIAAQEDTSVLARDIAVTGSACG